MAYGTRTTANILQYASGYCWVAPWSSGTLGTFVPLGYIKDTTISRSSDTYNEVDDTGKDVITRNIDKGCTFKTTFLERNADVRNFFDTDPDIQYTVVYQGAEINGKIELWTLPYVTFSNEMEYVLGGEAKLTANGAAAIVGSTDLVTTLTSVITGDDGWEIDALVTSTTCPASKFYVTTDETKKTP